MNDPSPYFFRRIPGQQEEESIEFTNYLEVEEQSFPLREYWLTLKRHRWLILLCAFVFLLGSALYTFTRTPLYTAQTTVLI